MKYIISILLYLFIMPSNVLADESVDTKAYINDLILKGYEIVKDQNLSEEQKFKKSADIIRANLHLDWMAKRVLGRNKLKLSPAKLKEFIDVYSEFVVNAYANLSKHYNGEKAVIKATKNKDNKMSIISMEIVKEGATSSVKVDYLIHKVDNAQGKPYKVADVITEGVSILNSQQAEFDSVIATQGIDALIADLKKKNSRKTFDK